VPEAIFKYPPLARCAGSLKPPEQKLAALQAVGASIEVARQLRPVVDATPAPAPGRLHFDPIPWQKLVTYLIAERQLIEFLTGPKLRSKTRYLYKNDICLDCFVPDNQRWRLHSAESTAVCKSLILRSGRISRLLAHLTWELTKGFSNRVDKGIWSTEYLDDVTRSFSKFANHLETTGQSQLALELRKSLEAPL
jgi:hypothetical protein